MEPNDILLLTKNHYNKKIKYYIFDSSHVKTDTIVENEVSKIFTEQEWNYGLKMLDKLQKTAHKKGELSFTSFWENFFIGVKSDIDTRIKHAKASALNVEQYLKFILVLLGHSKDVDSIQSGGDGASKVLGIVQKAGLFSSHPEEAPHIFDTIRCYANWWRHGFTKTENNNLEELRHTMIALPLTNEQDDDSVAEDNRVLSEHIRLILASLLIIIGSKKELFDDRLSEPEPTPVVEDTFDEDAFLDIYFKSLKKDIDSKLNNAIQELKDENEYGFFEHSFILSHSNQEDDEDNADTEIEDNTVQTIKLSQFRRQSTSNEQRRFKTNVILGMPGAGKSTALYMLIHECIQHYEKSREEGSEFAIPVFVPLRSVCVLPKEDSVLSAIDKQVGYCISDKDINYRNAALKCIHNLMAAGQVVLFFDGLNEISENRDIIVTDLIRCINKKMPNESRVFITGRKYEYDSSSYAHKLEEELADIGIWHLEDLDFKKIEGFLSADIRSKIIRGQIVELLSSPLNLRLFLGYLSRCRKDEDDGSPEIPTHRGEMLESFLDETYNKNNGFNSPFFANLLLKKIAVEGTCSKSSLTGCIENMPSDLVDRLAAVNVLSITPADQGSDEQVSFSLDTFQEFYRAKYIIDKLRNDKTLSLYSLAEDQCRFNPNSATDFETLKLIFEISSSPLCHRKMGERSEEAARMAAVKMSARIAKDFLNPQESLDVPHNEGDPDVLSKEKACMNDRLLTLCQLVRNIPFTRDIDIELKQMNAKDVAELLILNNLKWFRVTHPDPMKIFEDLREYQHQKDLITSAAIIGGSNIIEEFISSYWLLGLGLISPSNYHLPAESKEDEKKRKCRASAILANMVSNCKDYICFYDKFSNARKIFMHTGKKESASGISLFFYHHFMRYLPDHAKKHLLQHISGINETNASKHYAGDINTLLCYIGNIQLLTDNFLFETNGYIRIKELHHILRNFRDETIQRFVLSEKFFNLIDSEKDGEKFRSYIVRFYLFRLGLTPAMKNFLFKSKGLDMIPEEDVEGLLDMIPLQSIPRHIVEKYYDKDTFEFLIKEKESDIDGTQLEYQYVSRKNDAITVSILDIEENSLEGKKCHIGTGAFTITSDRYLNQPRLYCVIKAADDRKQLLPDKGHITSDKVKDKVPFQAASPNTELKFYLYGPGALQMYRMYKAGGPFFIKEGLNKTECQIQMPDLKAEKTLTYRHIRALELTPNDPENSNIPYSGELTLTCNVNKITKASSVMNEPARFESLRSDMSVKTEHLDYQVLGQNKSFLWVFTEKVVTAEDNLIGRKAVDKKNASAYFVRSVKPYRSPHLEFWFKATQKISVPSYGTFGQQIKDGDFNTVSYCFSTKSEDGSNFRLRVTDEEIVQYPLSKLYDATYTLGNISLQLISIEKIESNRRYSIWTLQKSGNDCTNSSGTFFIPVKGKKMKTPITVSGETRSSIKEVSCVLGSVDTDSSRLTLIAQKPEGIIGAGNGDYNLLKGLVLGSQKLAQLRFQIDKESEMAPHWIKKFNIRFDINPQHGSGYFIAGNTKIKFVRKSDETYWLWSPAGNEPGGSIDEILYKDALLHLMFDDGFEEDYTIINLEEVSCEDNYAMVIHCRCNVMISEKELSLMSRQKDSEEMLFNVQVQVPVLNKPVFPRTFQSLYPRHSVSYQRDVLHAGCILVPRPVSDTRADAVLLDNSVIWEIQEVFSIGNTIMGLKLLDKYGTPNIRANGSVKFMRNNKDEIVWYSHLNKLIDFAHPEKYHAELCDILLEEILNGSAELTAQTVNFFVKKSKAYDLVTNPSLLKAIENTLTKSSFNVCRVLQSLPHGSLKAYSVMDKKIIHSSDSMPENHDGKLFKWKDLVLIEKNRKLTLINDLPRYRCLGYMDGIIVSITSLPNYPDRKQLTIISNNKSYCYYYNPRFETSRFEVGDIVNFFATVNYKHRNDAKPAAEQVTCVGQKQPLITAEYKGQHIENTMVVYEFEHGKEKIEIKINRLAREKELTVGHSYRIITGARPYLIENDWNENN